jgi:hypothetical protein
MNSATVPPSMVMDAILPTSSGFLKTILQLDFVGFKYLLGTATADLERRSTHMGIN